VTAYDGHTATYIDSYDKAATKGNSIELDRDGTNNIKIISLDAADTFKLTKEIDRYSFDYTPSKQISTYSFIVTTEQPADIVYRENTPYKTWIISGMNWIDFYSDSIDNSKTKIVYADQTRKNMLVTVTNKVSKEIISFESIGDLNMVQQNYSFYTINGSVFYASPVLENTNNTIYLQVNVTGTNLTITDVNASLYYNNTLRTSIRDMTGSIINFTSNAISANVSVTTNVSFYWNISILGDSLAIYSNQTVTDINVTSSAASCSNYTVLNLTLFDEDIPSTYISNNIDYVFDYWTNPSKLPKSTIFGNISGKSLVICVNTINFGYDLYVQHNNISVYTHRYYLFNQTFTGTTYNDFSANYNDTSKSKLKITTKDIKTAENLQNILVKMQRFYVDLNTWKTVQMFRTGDYGESFFDIRESDTDYRLIFNSINNEVYKTTGTLSFLCTNYLCDITYLIDLNNASSIVPILGTDLSFNNVTKKVTLNWSDSTAKTSSVRLYVTSFSNGNRVVICNTTQLGSAGTMNCDVSAYNGIIQAQVFSSASPERAIMSKWFENTKKLGLSVINVIGKDEGMFWSFAICLIAISASLFSPVASILAAVLGLIVSYNIGFSSVISTTMIISACVVGLILSLKVRA
jgi:hypothetical protein